MKTAGKAAWQGVKSGYTTWLTTSDPTAFGESFGTVLTTAAAVAAPYAKAGVGAKVASAERVAPKVAPSVRPTVAGKITGYTKHGIDQAISHDGHGVAPWAILDSVKRPLKTVIQSDGRVKYFGKYAEVVLNKRGKVITVYAKTRKAWRGASPPR